MKLHSALIVAASLMIASTAAAQRSELKVGSNSPQLNVKTWIKGDATTIEKDTVYVIEFWATWCGPCRAAMPHLSKLQTEYEADGLRIIGISTEDEQKVRDFVQSQPDLISYTIAVDNNNATERAFMQAANLNAIPASFIVDGRGKVQYIGNPHSEDFEQVLKMVIDGRYDAKLFADSRSILKAAENARKMRNWRQAFSMLDQVIEVDTYIFAGLELDKFEIMMVDMSDPQAAYRHARELMTKYSDDPSLLVNLGKLIATESKIPNDERDLDLALELVERGARGIANARSDPKLLAVQAVVHYQRGDAARAASLQRRAWMIATPSRKPGYERVLRNYQAAADVDDSRSTTRGSSSFRR